MTTIIEFNKNYTPTKLSAIPSKLGLAQGFHLGAMSKVQLSLFLMELRDRI